MFLAIVGTQVFAVLMCGLGWFVTALPWTLIGLIWAYMLAWTVILDFVKLAIYRKLAPAGRPRPRRSTGHPGRTSQDLSR